MDSMINAITNDWLATWH